MIFDINDDAVKTIDDVVNGMRKFTTEDGKLLVTVFQDEGYVRLIGYYDCDMDLEGFDDTFDKLAEKIQNMVDFITPHCIASDELLQKYLRGISDNYFKPYVFARAKRIVRLKSLKAPEIVINNEIKAFTYYWILNQYCETL